MKWEQKYTLKEREKNLDMDKIPDWLKSDERLNDLKIIDEEQKEK